MNLFIHRKNGITERQVFYDFYAIVFVPKKYP